MSKNLKLEPLEILERYHNKYLEYEKAFNLNPFSEEDLKKELSVLVESDVDTDSDDFLNKMLDIVIDKPQKRIDVNTAAMKFIMFADFYLLVTNTDLPENIQKDYNNLEVIKNNFNFYYSVDNNKFIKNEEKDIDESMKNYLKAVFKQVKNQPI